MRSYYRSCLDMEECNLWTYKYKPMKAVEISVGWTNRYLHTQRGFHFYTIKQVFKYVIAYKTHVPSFADTWGWVMASDQPLSICAEEMDRRIAQRIDGELLYLNDAWFHSSTTMNKTIYQSHRRIVQYKTAYYSFYLPTDKVEEIALRISSTL
ncbi:uncharacterized protein LOC106776343 [Vigna radiata var. radiata]|uniref:Uncharacterized protein LOC106776343 n=1 Tax=Vigna radiata var. radiata TaxID=3916 RepID=A0A3Q0FHX1_VIGRR|nr:uncharacterized protein LOC106776343 [Vigna radiata var. radiata]